MSKDDAWIHMAAPGEESEELLKIYEEHRIPPADVDHILAIHSAHPETLHPHLLMYRQLMFGNSSLSRIDREMLAVTVSVCNKCVY